MASGLRVTILLFGLSGPLAGVWSWPFQKDNGVCCPKGWTTLDDHCYVFKKGARSFADAESICNLLGGNLASITSELENRVVTSLVDSGEARSAWIGLSDAIEVGDFLWTDGREFGFNQIDSGEPSDDFCLEILTKGSSGPWIRESCGIELPYVCIREATCSNH
uniref:galactose-specific lectin nattectin-like n=1 Tax=Doryrhamphus excisus TaxID=161450 RepID=UPI0025AE68E1|nr:galactose-specific lectin nattectin-like [Doryrhamphus excisus]XP_057907858.1 galactose-specific lectin nattectin-like [Doryrhamphus excisus]